MSRLLVVVDMQNDFIDGVLGTKEAECIVDNVKSKIIEYLSSGDDAVFTRDTHSDNYSDTLEGKNLPVKHCIRGSLGWEINAALPTENCVIIDKPAFGSVKLGEYAARLAPECVELVGLCTDICVISNAMIIKAYLPETPVCVCASCCAGVTPVSHENALDAMKMCQIIIKES